MKKEDPLEEVAANLADPNLCKTDNWIAGARRQAQQMYHEDEVKKLAFDFYYDMSNKMGVPQNLISENTTNLEEWFNQHKKKQRWQ
jgi:hypothetical protein